MAPVKKTTTAAKKSSIVSGHPSFLAMIQECIKSHPEEARMGVSRPTIKKFLADKYKIDMSSASNTNNLSNAIKRGSEKGDLNLPKGIGGRVKMPSKKAPAAGKENAPPKKTAAAKKPAVKKTVTKKPAATKAAAPKPAKTVAKAAAKPATKTAAKPAAKKTATKTAAKKPAAKKTASGNKATAAKAAAKKAAPKKKVAAKK